MFAASSARDQRAIARYDRQRRLVGGGVRYCRSSSSHSANQGPPPQVRNVRPCAFCGCDLEDPPYWEPLIKDVCSFECAWRLIVRQETAERPAAARSQGAQSRSARKPPLPLAARDSGSRKERAEMIPSPTFATRARSSGSSRAGRCSILRSYSQTPGSDRLRLPRSFRIPAPSRDG